MRFFVPSTILYLSFLRTATSSCYFPNGTAIGPLAVPAGATWTQYQPCNPDPNAISMCCVTNRTSPPPDTCLPNGLCGTSWGPIYRESCTDPDWKSGMCLKGVCMDASKGGTNITDSGMTQCDEDGSWCCGLLPNPKSCCEMRNDKRIFLASTVGIGDNIISTPSSSMPNTSSGTMAASTPRTPAATSAISLINSSSNGVITPGSNISSADSSHSINSASTSTPASSTNPESNTTPRKVYIGVGVGVGAMLLLLLSLLTYCFILKRKRKREPDGEVRNEENKIEGQEQARKRAERFEKPELGTWEQIHMMGGGDETTELHGRERFELAVETRIEVEG